MSWVSDLGSVLKESTSTIIIASLVSNRTIILALDIDLKYYTYISYKDTIKETTTPILTSYYIYFYNL